MKRWQSTLNQALKARPLFMFVALFGVGLLATDAIARVGGGQSYGGGSSGGGGGGGGGGALVYALVRFLIWLTIEHPVIGIPVDIIVIGALIYWFTRKTKQDIRITPAVTHVDAASTVMQQRNVQQAFNQLRRFDPNFSEIILVAFC